MIIDLNQYRQKKRVEQVEKVKRLKEDAQEKVKRSSNFNSRFPEMVEWWGFKKTPAYFVLMNISTLPKPFPDDFTDDSGPNGSPNGSPNGFGPMCA